MNVFYLDISRIGDLPIVGGLQSSCIHIRVPYKGWERRSRDSDNNVVIPMSTVKVDGLARWIEEYGRKLNPKKGEFLVFYQKHQDGKYSFGLVHDSRGIPKAYKKEYAEDQLSEFPKRVRV